MRPSAVRGPGRCGPRFQNSANAGGTPNMASARHASSSYRNNTPKLAPHIRTAFSSIAPKTKSRSPGELPTIRRTSDVAACCSSSSSRSRVSCASFLFRSSAAGLRPRASFGALGRFEAVVLRRRFFMACRPLCECREGAGHVMQKIAIALSSHARPQALDEASYSPRPDFWKGLEAGHVGPLGTQPIPAVGDGPVSG